jgi:hypothetical protein
MITFKTDIIRLKKIKATEIDALIKQLKEIKKTGITTFTVNLREEPYAPGNEEAEDYDWTEAVNKIYKKKYFLDFI